MYIRALRIQRMCCPVLGSCLSFIRDFCRVVYTGAYVNADVIFFSTSPGHLHEYAEHLQHSKRAWPAIVTPVIANKCICIFKLPRAKYSRAR